MAKKSKKPENVIALNRKARFDYHIEETYEAGIALEGWEVKSLRDGKLSLAESYVLVRNGEAFLFGAHITPLNTASTHIKPDPLRTRKLLMHREELNKLIGGVERKGYTLVPLDMHWKRGHAKVLVGYAKGKAKQDKRASIKERDWQRDKQRILKQNR